MPERNFTAWSAISAPAESHARCQQHQDQGQQGIAAQAENAGGSACCELGK